MPEITVGKENSTSIHIYYEDHGEGKPIVLIHGWPLSGASWEKQIQPLLDAGRRVITYDRRGFGMSSQPATGYDYDTFADDLDKLMVHLDLRDAVLAGFSMGGGEVVRYLGKFGKERVSKAVVLSGVPPFLLKTADNPAGVDPSVFAGIQKGLREDRPAFLEGFFKDFYNADAQQGFTISPQAIHASWISAIMASAKATVDCVEAWGMDFRDDVKRMKLPTLIIQGEKDRIVPIAASGKRMAETIEGCKYVVIEGAPHGILWTHAEKVNRELVSFLR